MTHRGDFISEQINDHGWNIGAELGVWDGRTLGRLLANTMAHIIAVDAWVDQGEYTGKDRHGNIWDHQTHRQKVEDLAAEYEGRVTIYDEMTVTAARYVEDASLDFIFIDADHSYEGVMADIEAWESKVRPGGWVMGHDINWNSVRSAVLDSYGGTYWIGPDNVWWVEK
jgi:hypothetical protein